MKSITQKLVLLGLSAFLLMGCFDVLKTLETHIVGDISVIDSNDPSGGNYIMIIGTKDGHHDQVTDDYVIDLYADDNKILVKALDHKDCNHIFYLIGHNKGHQPVQVNKIDSVTYMKTLQSLDKIYNFHTDHLKCP